MTLNNRTTVSSNSVGNLSLLRRWIIYLIGLVETLAFGGCTFGWGQLVYVLKNNEVFFDYCQAGNDTGHHANASENVSQIQIFQGCQAQDEKFAFIYMISCMTYGVPAVLMGMILHYFGLAVSRIFAASLLVLGFLALGCTEKDDTKWLYIAMISISSGSNLTRMSGLQFCNLFPRYRSTALAIISGSFAGSAGLFMIYQVGQKSGISLWTISLVLAGVATLSIPATFIIPRHHIPYDKQVDDSTCNIFTRRKNLPLRGSIFSLSTLTHFLWMHINLTGVLLFATTFNPWISRIARTKEEAGTYSMIYSISALIGPLFSPFPGLLIDYLFRKASAGSEDNRLKKEFRSPIVPMVIVILLSIILQSCLLFSNYVAIYVSLMSLLILRPSIIAVSTSFLRLRFPPEHFNRMIGITGTTVSMLNSIQYPIFLMAQRQFTVVMLVYIGLIGLTVIHPLHLLSHAYIKRISNQLFVKYTSVSLVDDFVSKKT